MFFSFFLFTLGLVLISYGANYLIQGCLELGKKAKISSAFLGVAVLGFGSSLPEVFVTIEASYIGALDITYSNMVGSNFFNILMVIGIAALVKPMLLTHISKSENIFLLITAISFAIICFTYKFNALISLLFLIIVVSSIYFSYKENSKKYKEEAEGESDYSYLKITICIIAGTFALIYGSSLFIESAVSIARIFNVSEAIIGLTLVAIGTSVPELVNSIVAAIKKQGNLAIYNVLGSNIFNLTILPFVAGLINTYEPTKEFNINVIIMLMVTLLFALILLVYNKKYINRFIGAFLVIIYLIYTYYILIK